MPINITSFNIIYILFFAIFILSFSVWIWGLKITKKTKSIIDEYIQRLRKTSDYLEQIIRYAPDATIVTNSDGTIIRASLQTETLLGYSIDDLINNSIEILVPRLLRSAHKKHRKKFLENPHPRVMGPDLELSALHKDGYEVPVEISLSPLYSNNDDILIIASMRDASIHRKIRFTLQSTLERQSTASEELIRIDALRSRFLEVASHELRTPLTSITGFIEILKNEKITDQEYKEILDQMELVSKYLSDTITNLLDFTKMEREAINLEMKEHLIRDLIQDTRHLMEGVLRYHHLNVILPENKLFVRVDRHAFIRVMINVLSNAAKHSPNKSTITITISEKGPNVLICVMDEGPGIPENEKELIFERFYRGQNQNNASRAGSGIGLSITRRLLEMHNGSIEVMENNPGATFCISLPCSSKTT